MLRADDIARMRTPHAGPREESMKRITIVAAAIAAAAVAVPVTAGAAPSGPGQAQILGTVVTHGDGTASVRARYVCADGAHLWVSAKQAADGRRDARLTQEGSSAHAAAWVQSHPTEFTCDGRWHTGTFQIDTTEQGFGELERGQAWVQFCMYGERTAISESRWTHVR